MPLPVGAAPAPARHSQLRRPWRHETCWASPQPTTYNKTDNAPGPQASRTQTNPTDLELPTPRATARACLEGRASLRIESPSGMRATPRRMRAHAGVCPRVRTLALSMLASRASSTSVPSEASVDAAVRGACARGLLAPAKSVDDHPLGFFYDLDAFEANMASLRHAFPPHWHHATAVKTNPLSALLRLTRDAGHGAECASIGEVQHVLRQGFAPDAVVYDSPCKTEAEIRFALERGDRPPPQRHAAPSPSPSPRPSPDLGSICPYPHPHPHRPYHLCPHVLP